MTEKIQVDQTSVNESRSYLTLGNAALRSENYNDAIKLFKLALDQSPELKSTILFNIAIAEKRISELTEKNLVKLKNKKVIVYTCNFGSYESVKEPLFIDSSVEYILFTDNKDIVSTHWQTVVIDEQLNDPRRASRLAKIMPHKYLPTHDISVYIDSSLELKTCDIRQMIAECMEGKDIALYKHYKRNCVYDEIEFVMQSTDRVVENKDLCIKAIEKYNAINYPRENGLFENAFIFRRNTKDIQKLSELWWQEYIAGTERDQFTFMYALWITGIKPNPIKCGNQFRLNPYVNFHKHAYRSHSEPSEKKITPYIFIAYAPKSYGMNLGRCYNEYMERLKEDEFALFIDHDAMFVSDSWMDTISETATKYADDIALFISRTNRINNPYQRLNLLEENHRIEDQRIFADQLSQFFSTTVTECAKLPSSSGVIIMLSKKTWEKHKFSDGFLKVDNNIHISHRNTDDPVYLMNGLYVYHFYRADNDLSHAVKDISALPKETESKIGHIVRNFIYQDFTIDNINRYMDKLKEDEYGVFLPEQSMFCNKDWYIRITTILEDDKNIGFMIFNDNSLDPLAPFELDALQHKLYASNMIEREISCLHEKELEVLQQEKRAFLLSKRIWKELLRNSSNSISIKEILQSAIDAKQKSKFIPSVYVLNSKIDPRKKQIKNYLNNQLNIGILTMGFWPQQAGMEMMVNNLATQMTKIGHNVVLFAPKPTKEYKELKGNYIIRRFKDFNSMKSVLREHHKSMPFDVLYVQGAYEPASLALEIKNELNIPIVLRTHGEDIQIDNESNYGYRRDPKKNEIIINNLRNVDHNIVIAPHIYEDVRGLTTSPVSLIFNGVDTDHFNSTRKYFLHERLNISKDTKILITAGRNVKVKSFHLAIDALEHVLKFYKDVVLVHAGKEGNGINLQEYAIKKGVSKYFYQIGEISYFEMPAIYQSSDIFVYTSKTESFGNVTVEAMSCGLPCVEFDYKVNNDKILNGKTGFIVPYGESKALADKILLLLGDNDLRQKMSSSARKHAINKFSWKMVREKYNNIFLSSKKGNLQ